MHVHSGADGRRLLTLTGETAGEGFVIGGGAQPVLIVNDLKHGATSGQVGLWIGDGTEAYFRDLRMAAR